MRVTDIPSQWEMLHAHVTEIFIPHDEFEEDGNADVFAIMRDGTTYGFTIFALENIALLMDAEERDSFVSPGMLVVRKLTWPAIFSALDQWVNLGVNHTYSLANFGILQDPRED